MNQTVQSETSFMSYPDGSRRPVWQCPDCRATLLPLTILDEPVGIECTVTEHAFMMTPEQQFEISKNATTVRTYISGV